MAVASDIQWKIATSAKGKDFPIGFVPDDEFGGATTGRHTANLKTNSPFGIAVDWPVVWFVDAKWVYTPQEVAEKTAITRYQLFEFGIPLSTHTSYCLQFSSMDSYHYRFHDEAGDLFPCLTGGVGNYSVVYQSKKPKITYISGK
ncbi:hypothetical protein GGR53DRAFT_464518 [Hypoxylon sp. FL1150]|nr:hypothetical protein GGR53DRAFT_464518 [Hypoxylon sp. FL1150]